MLGEWCGSAWDVPSHVRIGIRRAHPVRERVLVQDIVTRLGPYIFAQGGKERPSALVSKHGFYRSVDGRAI